MRISDWSSDVCSSDLLVGEDAELLGAAHVDREQEGIGAFARRRDAGGAAAPDVLGERGGPALHVVDRGGRAVGADADMILAAHVDGMFDMRSEEHTSDLQSLMRISYAVFCLKKNTHNTLTPPETHQ